MTHTGKSAGQHNDNDDKDVMGYALPRRENESVQVGLAVRDTLNVNATRSTIDIPKHHWSPYGLNPKLRLLKQ
jgi:hypothetical protein